MDDNQNHHLTEPILDDASYLDDELGLMLNGSDKISELMGHLTLQPPNHPSHSSQESTNLSSITNSILDQLSFSTELFSSTSFPSNSNHQTTPTSAPSATSNHVEINFSTDSLDKSLLDKSLFSLKKPNYTLAFEELNNNHKKFHLPDLTFLKQGLLTNDKISPTSTKHLENSTKNLKIQDWESLKILLPLNYQEILHEKSQNKPANLVERDIEEKEKDETDENFVKLRKNLKKRQSFNGVDLNGEKFKRFSLQEIEEVGVVCKGIEETLRVLGECEQDIGGGESEKVDRVVGKKKAGSAPTVRQKDNKESTLLTPLLTSITTLTRHLPRCKIYSNSPHAKTLHTTFCPALYSLFSDGLAPWIETLFGKVTNGVWRVVEGSVSGAPTTQILSELVLRINSESELMGDDGPLKFNAFVAGLLNLGTLPSYLSLLSTKDRLFRTHYTPGAFLYSINTLNKTPFAHLLHQVKQFNRIRYDLDIFYETKLLYCRINSSNNNRMKRSFSDDLKKVVDDNKLAKSKTNGEINKIGKFKKLQLQWEMISVSSGNGNSGGNNKGSSLVSPTGSRIPRFVGSSNRCSSARK